MNVSVGHNLSIVVRFSSTVNTNSQPCDGLGMPEQVPEFIYDDQTREVRVEHDGGSFVSYSDIDRDSYDILVAVDEFVMQSTTLTDDLLEKLTAQVARQKGNVLLEALPLFQERAVDDYQQCLQYQKDLKMADPTIANDLKKLLYKHEKLLKHYFRVLSIAQSLAVSYRLGFKSLSEHQLYIYPFVQNVCSTIEYLGQAVENRMGDGQIDLEQTHENAETVYKKLKKQELTDPRLGSDNVNLEEVEIIIPPGNTTKSVSELPITVNSMEWLWEKRCQIVHSPPLIVSDERAESLPDELVSSHIFTEDDMRILTELSFRVHFHSSLLFIKYISTYMKRMVGPMVGILYPEESVE